MSTRTVRVALHGEYVIENGPSVEGLHKVNGLNRNKKLPLRDKSVVFHLKRRNTNDKKVIRMTITGVEPALTSDRVYVTGFVVGGSDYGKVTAYYDADARKGEVEIVPLTPHARTHTVP